MPVLSMQAPVSQTLLIPLAARAQENQRKHPVISDPKAAEIFVRLDVSNTAVYGGPISTHGILVRTKVIDDEIKALLARKPTMTLINLGAGLDTRFSRLDNGRMRCYELDLPDVIDLRKRFFCEGDRIRFISKSVLDSSWVQECSGVHPSEVVIVAEGLLMYFSGDDVRHIFDILAEHFPGAHMYFDVVNSFFVGKGISSAFQWGLDRAKDITAMHPGIHLVRSWSTGDLLKERQPLPLRLMNFLPSTRNRSQILHIQFGEQ